jgi:hypothetical protein
MKTRLLWTLILSIGGTALYLGIARPEVSTTPKRIRDIPAADIAALPPVQLPAMVVAEPRMPASPSDRTNPSESSQESPVHDRGATEIKK